MAVELRDGGRKSVQTRLCLIFCLFVFGVWEERKIEHEVTTLKEILQDEDNV